VMALDLARFMDQNAQGFADAIQSIGQQNRQSGRGLTTACSG
jgi:hypothetical protein